jgi:hypothetical protein
MTRLLRAALLVAAIIPIGGVAAQDTLRLGLRYDPNTKPGVLVLRIPGVTGDSLRAILQHDFDNGDRINVVAGDETGFPDAPTAGKNSNYPLYAKLGAVALVQATPTAGGLHVAVHDVVQQKVARVKDFAITGAPHSREWVPVLHGPRGQGVDHGRARHSRDAHRVHPGREKRPALRHRQRRCVSTPVGDDAGVMSPSWHPKEHTSRIR